MAQTIALPLMGMQAGFRRFSVAEYHRLTEIGILTEDDSLELIEGYLIHKIAHNPPHDGTLSRVLKRLLQLLPPGWDFRSQMALTLPDSEPEPDVAIVRESPDGYLCRHPVATEAGLVIEIADSTLAGDQIDKGRIYARAAIPVYWIVNIPDRWIEVYEQPSGPGPTPGYAQRRDFHPSDRIPFVLDQATVAAIVVADLFG